MFKKLLLTSTLLVGLMAMVGTDANARVCVFKVGGTCVLYSGSLECGIQGTGLGNCEDKALGCIGDGQEGYWQVACGNPGSNNWTAPGINSVYFGGGTLTGALELSAEDCTKNGNANVTVYAGISQDLKTALEGAGVCPNPNWIVYDAVPCSVRLRDVEIDEDGCIVADAWFDCLLPDCQTLGWDSKNQKFERRQYECTRTEYNKYKTPECPQN